MASRPNISADLSLPPEKWWHHASRVIMERGVELRRMLSDTLPYEAYRATDEWEIIGKSGPEIVSYQQIREELRLSPILMGIMPVIGEEHFLLAPDKGGPILDILLQELRKGSFKLGDKTQLGLSLSYISEATLYHARQLALSCTSLAHTGAENSPHESEDFILSGAVEPYFEFEALVTAAVRSFETSRYLFWNLYGTNNSAPSNFDKTIEKCTFPKEIEISISELSDVYKRAKEYRDCVQHNAHFGARLPFGRIQLYKNIAWSILVLLPDNPHDKSYKKFSFDTNKDALTYGWFLANRVIDLLKLAIDAATNHGSDT